MGIKTITISLVLLLIAAGFAHGCRTPAGELTIEVPTPQTVPVGTNAVVQVIFRNLPEEGCVINMTWYGFGTESEPPEVTLEFPPSTDDPIRLQLVWESSNPDILGGQADMPSFSSPDGTQLLMGARDVNFGFYFETLAAGTTELTLTLTRADGSTVRRAVVVTVTGNSAERTPQSVMAEMYAQRFGVTIEEASFRLNLQNAFPGLSTALETNEKETFGGLWIQHEPEYKIVIAFTRNGEQTITKYSQYISAEVAPYIEIRTVKKSQVELLAEQQWVTYSLNEQGIKSESNVDIVNNCVSINILKTDREKFDTAVQSGKLVVPAGVKINFVDGLAVLD